jgi:DnaD/phage-associated family protein
MVHGAVMAGMPWFRYYSETRNDAKLIRIARDTGLSFLEVTGAWSIILCIANQSPVRGALYVTEKIRYCNEDVTDAFVTTPEKSKLLLDSFLAMGMIYVQDDTYCISNWEKRQRKSDDSNQRVRQYRDSGGGGNGKNPLPSTSTSRSLISIFKTYEGEIGTLTEMIKEELIDAEKEYTDGWVVAAIQEAVRNNKRNWKYALAILKRWKIEGFQSQNKGNGKKSDDTWKQGYTPA